MKKVLLAFFNLLLAVSLNAQQYPFQNPNLSSEERADDLLPRLTIEEKAAMMNNISPAIPRLGIKAFNWWGEALHGFADHEDVTVFPEPIGMAASWNDEVVKKVFNAVSDEIRAVYNYRLANGTYTADDPALSVWTPNINIVRDPRWGRGQESYGEDPYLMSRMGIAVVEGLQGPKDSKYRKLLACAKHYAIHSGPESGRTAFNVTDVDPRDLWETYLPAFKTVVQDADVREVMCAYSSFEDDPCCGNSRLLQRILRNEWGFTGLVVSDCGAIGGFMSGQNVSSDPKHAAAKGVLSGTDLECGTYYSMYQQRLPEALKMGLLNEDDINTSIRRLLVARFDVGEMDDQPLVSWSNIPMDVVASPAHKNLALESAQESMVLLQNKNNILPLSKSLRKVAVIGPYADGERIMWGNYNGIPTTTTTILEGVQGKLSAKRVVHDQACYLTDTTLIEPIIKECSIEGKRGVKLTIWDNNNFEGKPVYTSQIEGMIKISSDRESRRMFGLGDDLEDYSGKFETVFVPEEDGEIVFRVLAKRRQFRLKVNGESLTKKGGSNGPVFAGDMQFGRQRSMGKAATPAGQSFAKKEESAGGIRSGGSRGLANAADGLYLMGLPVKFVLQVEAGKEYKIEISFEYFFHRSTGMMVDFGKEVPLNFDPLIEKLKGIGVVIFAGGISSEWEREEKAEINVPGFLAGDRTHIEVPIAQRKCMQALKMAGKKVIFVNNTGSAVGLVPETEDCDAILQAWYGGEYGGQAVADILFGDFNPSGKLPVTFYKNVDQLPLFDDYSMRGRTYRYMSDPLYQFGYGLSYTTFSIGEAKVCINEADNKKDVELTIPVTNTGGKKGAEVVQVYIRKVGDDNGPLKSLRGFKRVEVVAGKSVQVSIELPWKSFEFFDRESGKMDVIPGEYEVWYGTSSADVDLKLTKITI